MGRAALRGPIVAAAALAVLGLGGCDESRTATATGGISAEDYAENLAEHCAQHGDALAEAGGRFATTANSDAERVAYFRTDWIPRVRTIILALNEDGFPAGAAAEYVDAPVHAAVDDRDDDEDNNFLDGEEKALTTALSHALTHLEAFEIETYAFIDAYAEGRLEPEDNYVGLILEDLAAVGITCVT